MRKFIVNVNGNSYEVEVEEVGAVASAPVASAPVVAAPAPSPAAAPAPVAAPAPAAAPAAPANGIKVNAPMPGTVVDIRVSNGAQVKKGDVIVILEAMKMENEIVAPCDGVASVVATKGQTVNSGDLLVSLS